MMIFDDAAAIARRRFAGFEAAAGHMKSFSPDEAPRRIAGAWPRRPPLGLFDAADISRSSRQRLPHYRQRRRHAR